MVLCPLMKLRVLPLTLLILLVPSAAFAQIAPVPPPPGLTTMAMVIKIINSVVGCIGQGIGQGNILGIVTVPKTWVPYLTVLAACGASVGVALQQGAAVLPAILFALVGLSTGSALAHHVGTPARTQSMTEGNSGKPPASSSPPVVVAKVTGALMLVFGLGMSGSSTTAGTGTAVPPILNLVSIVEGDLRAGDGDAQISSDICKALGGNALTDAVCGNVGVIVVDIVTYLVDGGTLPPAAAKRGQDLLAAHPKLGAGK